MCVLSHVWLFATPWTVARQTPLSMGFSRQEHWSGWPLPSPGDLPNPGTEPMSAVSPALRVDSLYRLIHQGSPNLRINWSKIQARFILSWSPDTVSPLNPWVWHPWFQPAVCGLASMGYQSHEYRGPAVLDGEGNGTPLSTLAWKILWTEEPGGLQSMGSRRVGHDWSDLAAAAALFELQTILKTIHARPFPTIEETDTCGHEAMSLMVRC